MSGQEIAHGEETDLLRRIRATMPNQLIYYDPRVYVYHLVRPEKMTMRWMIRKSFTSAWTTQLALRGKPPRGGKVRLLASIAFWVLALGLDVVRGMFWRDRTQYPYLQNYLYEHSSYYLERLGVLYEQFKPD